MVCTSGDGSVIEIGPPEIDYGSLDYDDLLILREVSGGVSSIASLAENTGISYKTMSKRLSRLRDGGFLECDDGRPRRYTMTEAQSVMSTLIRPQPCRGGYKKILSAEVGELWIPSEMNVVLDRSLSGKGQDSENRRHPIIAPDPAAIRGTSD